VSGADKNSIHSSEITDFGPAAPFRESLNDIGSDIFSGLEWEKKTRGILFSSLLLNLCHLLRNLKYCVMFVENLELIRNYIYLCI